MTAKLISSAKKFFNAKFVKSALFLFACVLFCKILGLVYRVPLTNIVKLEGIGLYQLVFPLYSFLLILSSNAVPLALSKIIAQKLKEGNLAYVSKIKRISFIFFFALGTFFSILLTLFAREISLLQGNENATLGYSLIAPSVLLVSLISVYRGIFQAEKNMIPTGVSQILEQVFKFGFGIFLPLFFAPLGLDVQVAMSLFAVTISEIVALIFLQIYYAIWMKKKGKNTLNSNANSNAKVQFKQNLCGNESGYNKTLCENAGECNQEICGNETLSKEEIFESISENVKVKNSTIFKDLIKNLFPILLSNLIVPFCILVESFLIVNTLAYLDVEKWQATAVYGAYSGIVCTLINAPITLISSIGSVLVPYVAENKNKINKSRLKFTSYVPNVASEMAHKMVNCVANDLNNNLLNINSNTTYYTEKTLNNVAYEPYFNAFFDDKKSCIIKNSKSIQFKKFSTDSTHNELKMSFKLTALISIPCVIVFALFSFFIISLLFPNLEGNLIETTAIMLSISSLNVVTLSYSYVISNYLQSIDLMFEPVKCFAIFNFLRIMLCFLALIKFGILGFVLASTFVYFCQFLQFLLILKRIK